MRQFYFLLICLFTFGFLSAQEELSKEEKERREKNIQAANPFAKFGYKAKVATLSKGKYLEVHDLDSIVTIGSVRFHVDKQDIVGYIEQDTTEYAKPLGDTPSRWLSVDPLAEEFPDWSPYTFVYNNPLRFVDPDGRAGEDWIKNIKTGEVKWFNGTGKVAEEAAKKHWNFFDSKGKTQNLGSSFFGTKTNNLMDNSQILKEQINYLNLASSKINSKAFSEKSHNINHAYLNKMTVDYLQDIFLGSNNSANKSDNKLASEVFNSAWSYGGANLVESKLPKNVFAKTIFQGFDLYLGSDNLGVGSDKNSHIRADTQHYFKTQTLKLIDSETLYKINLHKF